MYLLTRKTPYDPNLLVWKIVRQIFTAVIDGYKEWLPVRENVKFTISRTSVAPNLKNTVHRRIIESGFAVVPPKMAHRLPSQICTLVRDYNNGLVIICHGDKWMAILFGEVKKWSIDGPDGNTNIGMIYERSRSFFR
ncbi:hypothetical protein AVEN_110988-1 [Araneus ventricosus]|uniref:Uncharacterized protein n=1 Tax=Araneus ventricosus TaxID=182803 RepID=A0A4Y2U969_ARAVE|nr:hypothetical protein AVEN_110988-1 [Araneus ventricosus]